MTKADKYQRTRLNSIFAAKVTQLVPFGGQKITTRIALTVDKERQDKIYVFKLYLSAIEQFMHFVSF